MTLSPRDAAFDPNGWIPVSEWLVSVIQRSVGKDAALDLVQEAVSMALPRGARPWTGDPTLAVHLSYVVHDLRRKFDRRAEAGTVHYESADDAAPSSSPNPEDLTLFKDRRSRLYAAATSEFAQSPIVQSVLERILRGEMSEEEHVRATGLSREQVRNARARIAAFIAEWSAREDGEEARAQ